MPGPCKYGHEPLKDKGKKHPSSIGKNLAGVTVVSRPKYSMPKPSGGSAKFPAGVVRGDGTETLKGTEVKHLQKTRGPKYAGTKSSVPSGVVKSKTGLTVPKKVK